MVLLITVTRYNICNNIEVFAVGDFISVGVPREDRAKTDSKRPYCRVIVKAQPE